MEISLAHQLTERDMSLIFRVDDSERLKRLQKTQSVFCESVEQAELNSGSTGSVVPLTTCIDCPITRCATWSATGEVVTFNGKKVLVRRLNQHASQVVKR